jgi:hypothetical protein
MALPTITGIYPHPGADGPERTFYQGFNTGATQGVLKILGTITATQDFILTDFMASVVTPTDGATVSVKIKNEVIHVMGAMSTTICSHEHFCPGIRATKLSTNTAELVVANATATVSMWVRGYFD